MKYLGTKVLGVLMMLLLLACGKEEITTSSESVEEQKAFHEMSIGEAHNYLLKKAYSRFGESLRSSSRSPIDILEVVDYWYSLSEVQLKDGEANSRDKVKAKLVELYDLCRERRVKTSSELQDCLEILLEKEGGITLSEVRSSSSTLKGTQLGDYKLIYDDVYNHSSIFWSEHYKGDLRSFRASNNAIIVSDALGALWGGFFSLGAGAVISSAAASLVAENAHMLFSSYDWRVNPKYI